MAKKVVVLALLIVLCSCAGAGSPSQGTVRGSVYGWPAGPLGGGEIPARGAGVRFLDATDTTIASTTTDDRGLFALSMRPGHYRVLVHAFGRDPVIDGLNGRDVKGSQVYVDVIDGQTTALDILVDTGIR